MPPPRTTAAELPATTRFHTFEVRVVFDGVPTLRSITSVFRRLLRIRAAVGSSCVSPAPLVSVEVPPLRFDIGIAKMSPRAGEASVQVIVTVVTLQRVRQSGRLKLSVANA